VRARAVTDIGERLLILDEQARVGMAEIVEADAPKLGLLPRSMFASGLNAATRGPACQREPCRPVLGMGSAASESPPAAGTDS
jgi:hypothetical protein